MKVCLVGGGIASLAAAAFMMRDGDILGKTSLFPRNRMW
jgi:myosin-crossreactive antigen